MLIGGAMRRQLVTATAVLYWHIVHRAHKRRYLGVQTGDIYSREYILQPLGHTSLPQCGTFVPAELLLEGQSKALVKSLPQWAPWGAVQIN